MSDENKNTNETVTQEEYQTLKGELEAERAKASDAIAEAAKPLQEKVASLEAEVSTKTQDIETLKAQAEEQSKSFASLQASLDATVGEYRTLVVSSNPLLSQDLVQGKTIEEVKASVEKANALVGKIKTELENQLKAVTVPAGAPPRTEPDLSGLSPRDKIKEGIEKARKGG